MSVSVADRPIALAVAQTNAILYTDLYLRHHNGCPIAPLRRCDECEWRGQDMRVAVDHYERVRAAQLAAAGAEG